jgi:hypothetical protein
MSATENIKSACVPCAIGHFSTSATLLNEAVRFKKDGLTSTQVLDDIAGAIGEQNALERIDLTSAKIEMLPDWEKEMAEKALEKSRELRHMLESVQSMEELQSIAAVTEEFYKWLNREWASKRLGNCPTCNVKVEAEPKPRMSEPSQDYGSKVAEERRKFLEEIRGSMRSE